MKKVKLNKIKDNEMKKEIMDYCESIIPTNIIKFFDEVYGIDVSEINVVKNYAFNLSTVTGEYDDYNKKILLSSKANDITLVHEIAHYIQFNYDKAISIPSCKWVTIAEEFHCDISIEESKLDDLKDNDEYKEILKYDMYLNRKIEIDSRIAEAVYTHWNTGIVCEENIRKILNCGYTDNLKDAVEYLNYSAIKDVLIAKIEAHEKDQKEDKILFDKELEELIESMNEVA